MATAFHLRWILVVAGIAVAAFILFRLFSPSSRRDPSSRWRLPELPPHSLSVLCFGFLALALSAKYSQLQSMQLNGQDFWLFVDMLDQMSRGGFMLTRFAPQTVGWVQHGVVHPYFSFILLLPFTWMFGALHACLWFGPLSIAGAGALLGVLARPRWGNTPAVLLAAAFLGSSLVGRIVMYDVHPEALYPLATFAWAWAAGWGDGKTKPRYLFLATALLMGIKTDSFLVFFPLLSFEVGRSESRSKRLWLVAAGLLGVIMMVAQFKAVGNWSSGNWGPHQWEGAPVVIPQGAGALKGRHWEGLSSALQIFGEILAEKGGLPGLAAGLGRFLVSRPFLSLLLVAPWVVLNWGFWWTTLPLLGVYSLLEDPGRFINYYSAPMLGLFWLAAITVGPRRPQKTSYAVWMLTCSLLFGGSGLEFFFLNAQGQKLRHQASALASCVPSEGKGIVSSRFLDVVPRPRVWSDRAPLPVASLSKEVSFFFFSADFPSYELPLATMQTLVEQLKRDPQWLVLDENCRTQGASSSPIPRVQLWVRR